VIWAGGTPPFNALAAQNLKQRYNIDVFTGRQHPAGHGLVQELPGMEGATYYYFGIPKNPCERGDGRQHYKQFKSPPTSSRPAASRRRWRW
jgi:branched-chain amino acid transport system substrate-binding protein